MSNLIVLAVSAALLVAGLVENALHQRRIRSIPIRVNVNGTRGKSTVTRLIAAGLRAGGLRTFAKTTGTTPRLILPDGSEEPIRRRGRARISEQLWVARQACRGQAEALVVECMALEPETQIVYEHQLVKSTIGVITNIRRDHLDVMGPELDDVAATLALTVPSNGHLVTVDGEFTDFLAAECERRGSVLQLADASSVSHDELARFAYTSFAENVAIALKVCELLGVDRTTALAGMVEAAPDPGVSPVVDIVIDGRPLRVVNAFAANDVESTLKMWDDFVVPWRQQYDATFVLVNNRGDRPQRVEEMSTMAARLGADAIFYVGDLQSLAIRLTPQASGAAAGANGAAAGASGAPIATGTARVTAISQRQPVAILSRVASALPAGGSALMFLAGNTKGAGSALTEFILGQAGAVKP